MSFFLAGAAPIDTVLRETNDKSGVLEFKGSMMAYAETNFTAKCVPL